MTKSDQSIWKSFRNGDENAYELIYREHFRGLFRYARKFTNDSNLIKDCIQDLFLTLGRSRNTLGETDSIRFYLLKSLRRLLTQRIQQENLRLDEEPNDLAFEWILPIEHHILEEETSLEKNLRLKQAMGVLTKRQREAIYLKFYNDLDHDQIAVLMGISYQSVSNLLYQSLRILETQLTFFIVLIYWIFK
ncbi:MAG: sigma-70 family RNA polymerase sigma factor [Siphonobacter sp.]